MLNIKKYANGRFFETDTKKYIKAEKLSELIQEGEEIKVTLTKTGKDITAEIIEQFKKKETAKKDKKAKKSIRKEIPFIKTDKLVKWVGEIIDARINNILEIVKLPSKDQVAQLDENIKALNEKIDALNLAAEKKAGSKKKAKKKAKPAAKNVAKPAAYEQAPAPEKEDLTTTESVETDLFEKNESALEKNSIPENDSTPEIAGTPETADV